MFSHSPLKKSEFILNFKLESQSANKIKTFEIIPAIIPLNIHKE